MMLKNLTNPSWGHTDLFNFHKFMKNLKFVVPPKFQGIQIFRVWATCVQNLNGIRLVLLEKKIFEKIVDRQSDRQTDRRTSCPLLKLCNFKEVSRAKN